MLETLLALVLSGKVTPKTMNNFLDKELPQYLRKIRALNQPPMEAEFSSPVDFPVVSARETVIQPNEIDKAPKEDWVEVTEENMDKIIKSNPKIKVVSSDTFSDLSTQII